MYAASFPDWKKIGWHVGKRLKDILNPPEDTGPSREERRDQRFRDGLKGFVYFDDFDEIDLWNREVVDPIQISNTPLLERSALGVHGQKGPKTSVMLCHDYSGGYHEYEGVRPPPLDNKLYNCNYLQHVDSFIYFSHKLVCVPPPTWTNTMHRNGVKVMATFLIERHTPQIERTLKQENGVFTIVNQLAAMADAYGFDGWLLNIEGEFPDHTADTSRKLTRFISSLKSLLKPAGKVVWYDALTCENEVDYQNGLSSKNSVYALAADALFTNYRWTVAKVEESRHSAKTVGKGIADVFFGVDIWAQNTNMSGPPRVTFPQKGGGGTNTGVALKVLADRGFSTAIFGPAWTYEHFSTSSSLGISEAECVQRSMWEGWSLPAELSCDCRGGMPHHTNLYRANPILAYAREHPAGSAHFFETNFQGPFEATKDGAQICSTLGTQAVLPHLLPISASKWEQASSLHPSWIIYGELMDSPSRCLAIQLRFLGKLPGTQPVPIDSQVERILRLCLFKLNMTADGSLDARIVHDAPMNSIQREIGIYTAYQCHSSTCLEYHQLPIKARAHDMECTVVPIVSATPGARLVELGFYYQEPFGTTEPVALCHIQNILIKPNKQLERTFMPWSIVNLHLIERGRAENPQKRLAWDIQGLNDQASTPADDLPWSKTTGPFSHFIVCSQNRNLGRAYCTEFCLQENDFKENEQKGQHVDEDVIIHGILFGGGEVSSEPMRVSLDWVIV